MNINKEKIPEKLAARNAPKPSSSDNHYLTFVNSTTWSLRYRYHACISSLSGQLHSNRQGTYCAKGSMFGFTFTTLNSISFLISVLYN